ncbi:MAG: hypothetical protein R2706_16860 [Acidimicrobiales bacterium]
MRPEHSDDPPGLVLLHGFPSRAITADHIGKDLPELGERMASEMQWAVLSIRFRGCGSSTGDFSLRGWAEDASVAITYLCDELKTDRVWVAGFGTGGAIGLSAAAADRRVAGAAMAGSPADFDDWASKPERLLSHAHEVGAIKTPTFPTDLPAWKNELKRYRAAAAAEQLSDRRLLVLHGSDDAVVPQLDARIVADAHGAADLRIIPGAGHQLRYDPRALAILLGWLERTRHETQA